MPIIAENNSTPRVPMPAGNHIARCIEMIHIGTITEDAKSIYAGKQVNKVRITWETPDEQHDFGKGLQPFVVSKEFTLSMHEKATLRKILESWRGKAFSEDEAKQFDVSKLLGKACMLSVIHKTKSNGGGSYAEISSIAALPKDFVCPEQINPTRVLSYDAFDQAVFETLPDFIKAKIRSSKEYSAMMNPEKTEASPAPAHADVDDLPF